MMKSLRMLVLVALASVPWVQVTFAQTVVYPYYDRVAFNSQTVGTGPVTVGSVYSPLYQTPAQAGVPNSAQVRYVIIDTNKWEGGIGTYGTSGPTLTRTTVQEGTNGAAPISLDGQEVVYFTALSYDQNAMAAVANAYPSTLGADTLLGNDTSGSSPPIQLSPSRVVALLNVPTLGASNSYSGGTTQTFANIDITGSCTGCSGSASVNSVTGTAGQVTITPTTGAVVVSLPVTITSNETFSGTVNLTGPVQINGNAMTFPGTPATLLETNGNGSALTGILWSQIGSAPTTLAGYGIASPLPLAQGGTAATTAAGALSSLGALPVAGGVMTGELITKASSVSGAGLNVPQGTCPSSPTNGDICTTNLGMYVEINGGLVGPLGTAVPGGSNGQLQYNNNGVFAGFTMSGDAALVASTGVITVTKTNGTSFATSATTDTTNASNINSGTLPSGRLPNPTTSTLGGIESYVAVSHQWINTISNSGVPSSTQPACGDLSNAAASCSTDATNASNLVSGTLPSGRLPTPTAVALGGIESYAAVTHQWINTISTSGVPASAQPTFTDISGSPSAAQLSTNLSGAIDNAFGSTQGSILYRGVSNWTALGPGTSGFFLETQGSGANPTWAAASGGSGCTTGGSSGNMLTANGFGGCTTDTNSLLSNGALQLGSSTIPGSVQMGNNNSGTVTLQPLTGVSLGSVIASLPANTGTISEINYPETFSGAKLFTGGIGTLANGVGAIGASSTGGGIWAGQGSTYDLTAQNKNGTSVCTVATGTTNFNCVGVQVGGASVLTANQTITLSGDTTGSGTTSITTTTGHVNGVSYPSSPSANTVPVVTSASGGGVITYEQVNLSTAVTGQLPIGSVGSSGLSGTSPIVVASTGNVNLGTQNADFILAGPTSGSAAAPGFRAMVVNDLPPLTDNTESLAAGYTVVAGDMANAFNLHASSGTPALTLPVVSSTIFQPGMATNFAQTGTVNYTVTNSTGLTTNLTSPILPGSFGTLVANAAGGTLDFFGLQAPSTTAIGGLFALSGATTHQWVQYVGTDGVQHLAAIAASDLPAATTSTQGVAKLYEAPASIGWVAGVNPNNAVVVAGAVQALTVQAIYGRPEIALGATGTVDVYDAASGTACGSGTKVTTTAFDANGTAATNQNLLSGTYALAAGHSLCLKSSGSSWSTGASVGTISVYENPT